MIKILAAMVFFILYSGCQSSSNSEYSLQTWRLAENDSLELEDPWLIYSYSERQGKKLYEHYCAGCHGKQGAGDGINSYTLNPPPKNLVVSNLISKQDSSLVKTIAEGGLGVNRSVLMPAYFHTLTKDEITNVVEYIKIFSR